MEPEKGRRINKIGEIFLGSEKAIFHIWLGANMEKCVQSARKFSIDGRGHISYMAIIDYNEVQFETAHVPAHIRSLLQRQAGL